MSIVIESSINEKKIVQSFQQFQQTFHVKALLNHCHIQKKRGYSPYHLFSILFLLIFTGKNWYRFLQMKNGQHAKITLNTENQPLDSTIGIQKDAIYRFLQKPTFHWNQFLLLLSHRIIQQFIQPLNDEKRVTAFILDDSILHRPESQSVELLSWSFDHVSHQMVKGFPMLTLGWTDGSSFVPVSFSLLSSPKRYLDPTKNHTKGDFHPDSYAYKRREAATLEKPELALQMLQKSMQTGIQATYVLFDSWFAFPKFIQAIQDQGHHAICMLKKGKSFYEYQGKWLKLESLFKACQEQNRNRRIQVDEKTTLFGSLQVTLGKNKQGQHNPIKIVFVQNRNKKSKREWLAILSTDTSLSDEEIIRIYGKRWEIEVFFKSIKSILKVEKEFQLRIFDSINAHVAIVCCRYCYLSWLSRKQQDIRTCGTLFYQCCEELKDIQFRESLERIIKLLISFLVEHLHIAENKLKELFTLFLSSLPSYILLSLDTIKCES